MVVKYLVTKGIKAAVKKISPYKTILKVEKVGPKKYEAVMEDVIKAFKKGDKK